MIGKMLDARLRRLEARAVTPGRKAPMFLEARGVDGNWTGGAGGRWVAGDAVYSDADLRQLERQHFLILICQHGKVTHDD